MGGRDRRNVLTVAWRGMTTASRRAGSRHRCPSSGRSPSSAGLTPVARGKFEVDGWRSTTSEPDALAGQTDGRDEAGRPGADDDDRHIGRGRVGCRGCRW